MGTAPDGADVAARLWRRQGLLVGLTAAVTLVALVLLGLMLRDGGVDGDAVRNLTIAVAVAIVATIALLGACVVHTYRVAAFTFRRQES